MPEGTDKPESAERQRHKEAPPGQENRSVRDRPMGNQENRTQRDRGDDAVGTVSVEVFNGNAGRRSPILTV